jgi:PAT family beta-lactamase induction signal transducer AmpG
MSKSWRDAFAAYADRRLLVVLAMGFSSGLPLALTGATLSYWLRTVGLSRTDIGLFSLIGIAYNVKFLWAPVLDHVAAPFFLRHLGRRRSWALVTQLGLVAALLWVGSTDPATAPFHTALAALFVAFFSASQDIAIDAYRVEILDPHQQGAGAAMTQYGYRIGLLAAGAGALLLSTYLDWFGVYAVMALLVGLGMLTVLLCDEPGGDQVLSRGPRAGESFLHHAVVAPLLDLANRPRWYVILPFVVLYKLSDALAGVMTTTFYVDLHFTAAEIAGVTKVVGLAATVLGVFAGGALVARMGLMWTLMVGGIVQAATNALFSLLAVMGHDVGMLAVAVFLENFTSGIGSAALVAYLSSLCSFAFTATQYALLSSLAAIGRTILSSGGGWLADRMDWATFFLLTTFAGLPGLILLLWLIGREPGAAAD